MYLVACRLIDRGGLDSLAAALYNASSERSPEVGVLLKIVYAEFFCRTMLGGGDRIDRGGTAEGRSNE